MKIMSASSADIDRAILGVHGTSIRSGLEAVGISVSRYGLVLVLLLIGVLKFTPGEAAGIQPLVAHNPLMSWMYGVLSVQGVSNLIGTIEIAIAALIALRPLSPRASFVGSLGAARHFCADGQLPVLNARRRAVEVRVSRPGGHRPIPNQGPGASWRIALDRSLSLRRRRGSGREGPKCLIGLAPIFETNS